MNIKTIALITATVLGGSLLATNNTYADTLVTIPFEEVNMCNAVATNYRVSSKIKENNCSDETNPNIIMTDSNIESITELYLGYNNISKITGIEYFTSLTNLDLYINQITDLTPLSSLTSLTELNLSNNQITDLTPLKDLTSLTRLDLSYNQITDLTPLKDLTSLINLYLSNNQITDLTTLKDLTSLTELDLAYNQISNLTPLAGLTNLEFLSLVGNPFNDITPILLLDVDIDGGLIGENVSTATTSSEMYELPSFFLLINNTLDLPEDVAPWVTTITEQYVPLIEWEFQNAKMNEDDKSITIQDVTDTATIAAYANIPGQGRFLAAQLTVTYKESPEPEPTPTPDNPPVPNTGKNTKESSTAVLTATLCILSGIVLAAIPMARFYYKK